MSKDEFYDWLHAADQITRESCVPEDTKKYMIEVSISKQPQQS